MPDFQIADKEFILMRGKVPAYGPAVERREKRGEDGYMLRAVGFRTPEFSVDTISTFSSESSALAEFELYLDLVGNSGVSNTGHNFTKDGTDYSALETAYNVHILNIEKTDVKKHNCILGTSDKWALYVRWTLILRPL